MIDQLLRQRACRRFLPDPVPASHLHAVLEAATHAPSAENRQPWVFVVARAPATREAIAELTRRTWIGGARQHAEGSLDARLFTAVNEHVMSGYGGAPVLIVVAGDGRDGTSRAQLAASIFPAAQNLLLAAADLGYGSSLTTLAAYAADDLAAIVGLPGGVHPFAVIPVGRPAIRLGPPRRRPVHEVAHRESFGVPLRLERAGPEPTPRLPRPPV